MTSAILETSALRTSDRESAGASAPTDDIDAGDVLLARRGSREAFDRLIRKHQGAVIDAAAYCLSNPDDALDAAQETFLKAYRGLKHFRGSSSFRTWVLRIAVNSARSLHSRQKALKRGGAAPLRAAASRDSDGDAGGGEIADPWSGDGPARLLERKEVKAALESAIAALDDSDREVITLRDLSLQSYESIAQRLDLPLGTVKSRVHRARVILRERMAPYL